MAVNFACQYALKTLTCTAIPTADFAKAHVPTVIIDTLPKEFAYHHANPKVCSCTTSYVLSSVHTVIMQMRRESV